MKRSIGLWQLMGFAVTSLAGTLLHFLYEWLGEATWIAPFSGVNESTWEHMKLLFWPMLLFAVVQSFFFRDRGDFWCVKQKGVLLGLALIPILFYTYNGVIGKSPDWINIVIFFLSAAMAYRSLHHCSALWDLHLCHARDRHLQGSADGELWNIKTADEDPFVPHRLFLYQSPYSLQFALIRGWILALLILRTP